MIFNRNYFFLPALFLLFPVTVFGAISVGEQQHIVKVYDLPNTDAYKLDNGNYVDLATLHYNFMVSPFLPLWVTQEPKIVGYDKQKKDYYEIPQSELDQIYAAEKIKEEDINKISFYSRYGGKIILLGLISLIIYGQLPSSKEKVKPQKV